MTPHAHQPQQDHVDSWLMSYADMITLLLCFFVIFLSVSEPKKGKMEALAKGMSHKFGSVEPSLPMQELFRSLQGVLETRQVLKDVAIDKNQTAVIMELTAGAFYKANTAEFADAKLPVLADLAAVVKKVDILQYRISIEGYTSDVASTSTLYPSNWEFSSARAARMVRFFIEQGIKPEQLVAMGFGDTRPEVPNIDKNGKAITENRWVNDRIIIRIEKLL